MPLSDIRITVPLIGGGFGGKGVASQADFCASILSRKIGRPVKMTYERSEVFATNNGRHPCYMNVKMGFDKNGKITACEFNNLMDEWSIRWMGYRCIILHSINGTPTIQDSKRKIRW